MKCSDIYYNLISRRSSLAVVGLGYVGLPLAAEFSSHVSVIGYDRDSEKIRAYRSGVDPTNEVGSKISRLRLEFTDDPKRISEASFIIVAVQTPVDGNNMPDFSALKSASRTVGENLSKGSIVVFESTVYPGATENICIPVIEEYSGLKCGEDWKIAYSPERVNPGDRVNTISKIKKIVSGMDEDTVSAVKSVYDIIIAAGTYPVSDIKTAEAIKVIENTQRDVNIAFMNEAAIICNALGIDTAEVIRGMDTKWNALGFKPGLVGGHCIDVDPYYIIEAAAQKGYDASFIRHARELNESVPYYIAGKTFEMMQSFGLDVKKACVVVLGITFKENCPDIRNSKVRDLIKGLGNFGINPVVSDPWANADEVKDMYGIELCGFEELPKADCVIVAVGHRQYRSMSADQLKELYKGDGAGILVDVKSLYRTEELDVCGLKYFRL